MKYGFYYENDELLELSDKIFNELNMDYQSGIIGRLHALGDNQEGKTNHEHNKKAKPYHDKANYFYNISKIWKGN